MEHPNHTLIKHFILTGFSQNFWDSISLFAMFFVIYILTILGNSFLIFTVIFSPQLHTPMYYFLCNLAFVDLCLSSCNIPRLLFDLLSKNRKISLISCLTQMTFNLFLGGTECILLAVMAYDRYIAICLPLNYSIIMSWRVCRYITVLMWCGSFLVAAITSMTRPLVFCKENILNHFTCEVLALLEVACGDLSFIKISIVVVCTFTLLSSPAFIVGSYICIIISLLKIHSVGGRYKAFSTCTSHLTVVLMFFGTSITMYMGQAKTISANQKYYSLIYAVFTPVINPLIYSLRNNEVKVAFRKILAMGCHF
ncbi:hypothetical protein GDO78_022762 [Eleutherodactylus coqui]|uniref:Olfactory receptor n=1 Tax=Eleutherodactylus coqui TaxID=57060 RepID=A0A8J6EGA7_ELECQ|nr:hypothetical protein GDO78_022762 [Eleutherodactylus coqui]